MPSRLGASDKKLLTIAGGAMLVLLAGTVVAGPPAEDESTVPSIYSSGRGGARAAWLLLRDLGYKERAWEEPPSSLRTVPSGALLIIAEPTEMPSEKDRPTFLEFVKRGGRILFCGKSLPAFVTHAGTAYEAPIGWTEFQAIVPGATTRNAQTITMQAQSLWKKRTSSLLWLYGDDNAAAVVEWRIGAGSVLWWAGATPLTNAGITQTGNLNFFLNSVNGTHERPPVILWDEYFHGQRTGLGAYIARTPVIWGGIQILLVGLAVLFTFTRRSGPVVSPAKPSRLSPLEFVDTMGGLYRRAGAAAVPVEISYRHLRFLLTRRLGVAANLPEEELARLAAQRYGMESASLTEDLKTASTYCFDRKIPARKALDLVKRLEGYTARLDPAGAARAIQEEKK